MSNKNMSNLSNTQENDEKNSTIQIKKKHVCMKSVQSVCTYRQYIVHIWGKLWWLHFDSENA